LQKARISPDAAFSVTDWTANVLFIVVIGGVATIEGPFVGVFVLFVMQEELASFGAAYLFLLGGLAILVMVAFPKGLWGSFADRFDVHFFAVRRRLVSPAVGPESKDQPTP
jgi:branched-chain amino acid transport system permease protein